MATTEETSSECPKSGIEQGELSLDEPKYKSFLDMPATDISKLDLAKCRSEVPDGVEFWDLVENLKSHGVSKLIVI